MAITNYLNLITSQHRSQPNFIAWLSAALQKIDDGMTMTNSIPTNFSVGGAVGNQLDAIGQLAGAKRDTGKVLSSGTSVLDDDHYRTYIRAKIAANQWDGTTPHIYDVWNAVFPNAGLKIADNQNMTMAATVSGISDATSKEMINNGLIIPKPLGVSISSITFTTVLIWDHLNTVAFNTTDKYTWDQLELSSL